MEMEIVHGFVHASFVLPLATIIRFVGNMSKTRD
jgi:hypothetical protein